MRIFPCSSMFCFSDQESHESQSHHSNHLNSESSNSSTLLSQPSLPSVPSLTSLPQQLENHPLSRSQCISTLQGHTSPVYTLVFAGEYLFSGSSDSEIRAWSQKRHENSLNKSYVVASGNGAIKSLLVLGDKLFSAHQDHKIRVWKLDHLDQGRAHHIATLPTVSNRLLSSLLAKNYVQIRRHKKCTWVHHFDTVSALAVSKDGSLLYSASWDRSFKVWRTSDFKCLESLQNAHDDAINAIVVSADGLVYTGSADKKIKVWKKDVGAKKHALVATLEKHKSAVNALALSIDGSMLYSGACDRSIIVWQKGCDGGREHMVVAGALRGHTKAIFCLAVVDDIVVSGSADNSVRIWRRGREKSYECVAVLEGHRKPVKCLAVTVDNRISDEGSCYKVYSGSLDCDVRVWTIEKN